MNEHQAIEWLESHGAVLAGWPAGAEGCFAWRREDHVSLREAIYQAMKDERDGKPSRWAVARPVPQPLTPAEQDTLLAGFRAEFADLVELGRAADERIREWAQLQANAMSPGWRRTRVLNIARATLSPAFHNGSAGQSPKALRAACIQLHVNADHLERHVTGHEHHWRESSRSYDKAIPQWKASRWYERLGTWEQEHPGFEITKASTNG